MSQDYILACGHMSWGETRHCAHMECSNYTGKFLDEAPNGNPTKDERKHLASTLATVFESTKFHFTPEQLDAANDKAIEFIIECGFDSVDSDQLGDEMCDSVQTLLTLAFLRIGLDNVAGAL